MKELNRRLIEQLPENRLKSMKKEIAMRRQADLSKRKEKMGSYAKKIKENVLSNKTNQ